MDVESATKPLINPLEISEAAIKSDSRLTCCFVVSGDKLMRFRQSGRSYKSIMLIVRTKAGS